MLAIFNPILKLIPCYHEVTVLLDGGHELVIRCSSYEFTKSTIEGEGYTKYSFKGLKNGGNFGYVLSKMVGFSSRLRVGFK